MTSLKSSSLGLVSALALLAVAPAANAADIYNGDGGLKDSGPVDYAPPITWTGFYIGANLGAVWDDSDDIEIVDDSSLIGGGHLGYNWQGPRNITIGIEGDVDFLEDVDYLATIRGRLGYAVGPTLAYVTGGAAFIGLDEDLFGDDSDTGWVAGLGMEHKLRENISFGVEGLYYGFEDEFDDDASFWAARARLTYHFGGLDGGLR
jgi:outer membrane immunogenic protein